MNESYSKKTSQPSAASGREVPPGISKKLQAWRDGAGDQELGLSYRPSGEEFANDVIALMSAYKRLFALTGAAPADKVDAEIAKLHARDAARLDWLDHQIHEMGWVDTIQLLSWYRQRFIRDAIDAAIDRMRSEISTK